MTCSLLILLFWPFYVKIDLVPGLDFDDKLFVLKLGVCVLDVGYFTTQCNRI